MRSGSSVAAPRGEGVETERSLRRDRAFLVAISIWLAATIGFWSATVDGDAAWFALAAGLVLVLPWSAVVIWALVVALRHAARGTYRGAALAACVPVIAALSVFYGGPAADYVRFRLERAGYLAAIEAAREGHKPPQPHIDIGPPAFAYFTWGGMIWSSKGVAYDETDEAGRPETERSDVWRKRHDDSEFSCDAVVRPLGGHFYMVYAGC
jgi:hypothetical protein